MPDERAFSNLDSIEDVLRNSRTDKKLNSLSLMSIENEVLHSLSMDKIIEEFILYMKQINTKSKDSER